MRLTGQLFYQGIFSFYSIVYLFFLLCSFLFTLSSISCLDGQAVHQPGLAEGRGLTLWSMHCISLPGVPKLGPSWTVSTGNKPLVYCRAMGGGGLLLWLNGLSVLGIFPCIKCQGSSCPGAVVNASD